MEILYIAIAVTALGSIVLSLLARRDQILADQANEALLRMLQERTRERNELQERVRELEAGNGTAEWPLGSAATTEAADGAEGGGEDGA